MLKNRCALVTGSVSGLGYAIAESLAKAGANVVVNGLCEAATGEAAASRLAAAAGVDAIFDGADLADVAAIERMFANARARFGGVDIVVNNAVVRYFSPIESLPTEQWNNSLAVNVSAAFHCVRLALPGMREKGWGRIINLSSIIVVSGRPNYLHYTASKSAMIGMTRAMARELGRWNITVNALLPGTTKTDFSRTSAQADHFERAMREQAIQRVADMSDHARVLLFLCSDDAGFVTGQSHICDGGRNFI